MLFRTAVNLEPEYQPDESQRARDDERPLPSIVDGDEGDCEWGDNCADVRSRIEDACCERALLLRKPFGDGLDGRGEVPSFAKSQSKTRCPEPESRARQRVAHRGD